MTTKKKQVSARPAVAPVGRKERRNAVSKKPAAPQTQRGNQTRDRLKEAAVRVLERIGYRAMRLSDIAAEAGVNVSLLYHYFSGKADLTHEILSELLESWRAQDASGGPSSSDAFESILRANKVMVTAYSRTPGLMRCLLHFDEEEAEFSELYRRVSADWSIRIAKDIARRCPGVSLGDEQRLMIAYALGGMVDNFLFELYVDRNPNLVKVFSAPDDVAHFLAILWYRTVYLTNPPAEHLRGYEGFASLRLGELPAT